MKKTPIVLPPLTNDQKDLLFAQMMQERMTKIGTKGGKNSRRNLPDKGASLGRRAVETRWARYHAKLKGEDPSYEIPEKYKDAVAAIFKTTKE